MLLDAPAEPAAKAVVRDLRAADLEADGANPYGGTYPGSIRVPEPREPGALDANTIDLSVST